MIVKKLIEVEKVCCDICGAEIPNNIAHASPFGNLHTFFNYNLPNQVNRIIEATPFCLCEKCQDAYEKEIAEELFETYKMKLTEIKLRRN